MSAEQIQQTPKYIKLAQHFKAEEASGAIPTGYTYDDIILLPGASVVGSPDEVDLSADLAPNIRLRLPVISSNMDTVTEDRMAIAMALEGGIGALHRAMTTPEQCQAIQRVKNHAQFIIDTPPIVTPLDTVGRARELMEDHKRGYVVVLNSDNGTHGIITTRDIRHPSLGNDQVLDDSIFTPHSRLVTASPDITMEQASRLMYENRVEKLVLIDGEGHLAGVITDRDLREIASYPNATKDTKGRLQVLASVGVGQSAVEDALALAESGADGIIIDVLHGDTPRVKELTTQIRARLNSNIPLIVGNVATAEQTRDLINAGANVVKVGWGPGGFCTTRVVTATGAAQFRSVVECSAEAANYGVTIIADGGIKYPGDLVKAYFAGASAVMIGSMLIGTDESPGPIYVDENGGRYKLGRGSASSSASQDFARANGRKAKRRAAQGIEGVKVKYSGSVGDTLFTLADGTRNGIGAVGARNIQELQLLGRPQRQTMATLAEGQPHIKSR